jgi:hypothetical protein
MYVEPERGGEAQNTFIALRSDAGGGSSLSICLGDIAVVTYEIECR